MKPPAILLLAMLTAAAQGPPPELVSGDVRNAADGSGGPVAPGEVVVLFPSNAGPLEMVPRGLRANLDLIPAFGDTRVFFDGIEAPIIYTVCGRIGTIVPHAVESRKTTSLVVEYQGKKSAPVVLPVVLSAPAVYTLDGSGTGQAAMLNETGCCNSVRNPALLGSIASLWATGEGKLSPGLIAPEVAVTVGGIPAQIRFMQNDGSLQVNFRIPPNAPTGDTVPLVITAHGRRSSPDVTIAIRSSRQRLLIVDANAASRARLSALLGNAGYQVAAAKDCDDAKLQAAERPDLLLIDLTAAPEKAHDLIGKLRETQPQMRIIVMAADLKPKSLRDADLLGAQSVLAKPLATAEVLEGVKTLLRKKPAAY